MSRLFLRRLERWKVARALVDFHSIVPAHVFLGKATFVLAWVHTIAHFTSYAHVSHLPAGAEADREPAHFVKDKLPISYHDLFLTSKARRNTAQHRAAHAASRARCAARATAGS